jgi:hypothetical protein
LTIDSEGNQPRAGIARQLPFGHAHEILQLLVISTVVKNAELEAD